MLLMVAALLPVLVLVAVIALFVAYPLRGRDIPRAGFLSGPLQRVRESLDPHV
jgi:hypothetical protein